MVERYRSQPRLWPDGIDSKWDRWYGDGGAWTEERIAAARERYRVVTEGSEAKAKPKLAAVNTETETGETGETRPWEAAGVSRATWFRKLAKGKREGK
jgi:hypothetical protein